MYLRWIILMFMTWMSALFVSADVKLPSIISDNMVLQQGMRVPIWGWGEPGESITVTLNSQCEQVVVNEQGRWKITFDPLKAGGPVEMTVSGKNRIKVKNILIGEVWLFSGQSNMQWTFSPSHHGVVNGEQEIAKTIGMTQVELDKLSKVELSNLVAKAHFNFGYAVSTFDRKLLAEDGFIRP